jgi:glutamate 5-kinase
VKRLNQYNRIVIKIGSALLANLSTNTINQDWLASLLADINALHQMGKAMIIVSSGAVALGKKHLAVSNQKLSLQLAQAAAAIGQVKLAHAYDNGFRPYHITTAQLLLTLSDSENRKRFLNASNTLEALLNKRIIPIINENDTVATSEIRYGDNDRLAARVAQMARADLLILLSDVDGLYTKDPNLDKNAQFIEKVTQIDKTIEQIAGESVSCYGSGGMRTKIQAAKIATASGCQMCIMKGNVLYPLTKLNEEVQSTWFDAKQSPESARKNWIRQHLAPLGNLFIDDGALYALQQGKSLLPIGVSTIKGTFSKGDALIICDKSGQEIGRGLSNYSSTEARLIKGKHSGQIEKLLGYVGDDELIHRNQLVLERE